VREYEHLNVVCDECKVERENNNARYCCTKMLSGQPDFREQKIWLQEEVLDGFNIKTIFYPKFHCEF
jgi:hypothetical protein